ncbi:hypothetical protein H4R34_000064 [Dimargaris verticillata]|uniref:Rpr2-domain-containing protein n=1 Tax=Dimargaris verticillata TaxID=2761393 RepID=A0A9W8EGB2_9FUNG|nr:hypothetical protein H4R34_000064 [Dimargaris verticillata]
MGKSKRKQQTAGSRFAKREHFLRMGYLYQASMYFTLLSSAPVQPLTRKRTTTAIQMHQMAEPRALLLPVDKDPPRNEPIRTTAQVPSTSTGTAPSPLPGSIALPMLDAVEVPDSASLFAALPKSPIEDAMSNAVMELEEPLPIPTSNRPDFTPLARIYSRHMKRIGKRMVIRIDPAVKRTLCTFCETLLVPGITCHNRVQNAPQTAAQVQCMKCGHLRTFVANPRHCLFSENPDNYTLLDLGE